MQAEEGITYAQILNGKCHWIFTGADLPEWNEAQITAVDITGQSVEIGDLWDGNTFSAPPALPPAIPHAVTMRQARLALRQAGLLQTVNDAVASMPGAAGEEARIEWEYSQEVQRDKALVLSLAPALGLSSAQLDALFLAASAL